jgi:DNA replication and repair protein RecF
MFVSHLSITHFRNYQRLELDFSRRLALLQGPNAQGKTNLLEAIYFLATSKPVHATNEREVVDWQAQEEPIPYSRLAAVLQSEQGGRLRTTEVEILLTPKGDGLNFTKQVRINGVNKRSMDLIGLLRAVLFLPEDIKLVDGAPSERRRYLDIALCQIDPRYTRALAAYQKVVTQRNSLLRTLREQGARAGNSSVEAQLGFWDERLVQHGAMVVAQRHNFVQQLAALAKVYHVELSAGREELELQFLPSFNYTELPDEPFAHYQDGLELASLLSGTVQVEDVAARFAAKLVERRARELAAGSTLYGPHRDDLRFLANGRDLRLYGSRGQQRTAALALKLAEVQAMTAATGEAPLLLLDDVMSELDAQRRGTLLAALEGVAQAVITTTDWEDFTPEFRLAAQCFTVRAGSVQPHDGASDSGDHIPSPP